MRHLSPRKIEFDRSLRILGKCDTDGGSRPPPLPSLSPALRTLSLADRLAVKKLRAFLGRPENDDCQKDEGYWRHELILKLLSLYLFNKTAMAQISFRSICMFHLYASELLFLKIPNRFSFFPRFQEFVFDVKESKESGVTPEPDNH